MRTSITVHHHPPLPSSSSLLLFPPPPLPFDIPSSRYFHLSLCLPLYSNGGAVRLCAAYAALTRGQGRFCNSWIVCLPTLCGLLMYEPPIFSSCPSLFVSSPHTSH